MSIHPFAEVLEQGACISAWCPCSLWCVHPYENWGPVLSCPAISCLPCTPPDVLFPWKMEWHIGPSTPALQGEHIYITWSTLAGAEGSHTAKPRGRTAAVLVSSALNNITSCPQLFDLSAFLAVAAPPRVWWRQLPPASRDKKRSLLSFPLLLPLFSWNSNFFFYNTFTEL